VFREQVGSSRAVLPNNTDIRSVITISSYIILVIKHFDSVYK